MKSFYYEGEKVLVKFSRDDTQALKSLKRWAVDNLRRITDAMQFGDLTPDNQIQQLDEFSELLKNLNSMLTEHAPDKPSKHEKSTYKIASIDSDDFYKHQEISTCDGTIAAENKNENTN